MTDSNRSTDPVSLPMDVKRKLLAARDALAVGDLMEAHHQIYSIASPHFNKLADEVWTALETPTPDSPGGAREALNELHQIDREIFAPEPSERQPDGYAYRYPDGCIRFSGGREINGSDPVESIPYYFRRAPEPGGQHG